MNHFAVYLKITQYWKSTRLQKKIYSFHILTSVPLKETENIQFSFFFPHLRIFLKNQEFMFLVVFFKASLKYEYIHCIYNDTTIMAPGDTTLITES